jgi:ATP-dependent exoDNAse (exonuclease V) beta subunit
MDFIGFAALRDKRIKDGFVKDAEIEEYFLREANPKKLVDFEETVAMRLTEALDAGEKIEKRTVKQSATAVSRGNKLGRFEKDKRFDRGNAYHKVMQYVDFNDGEGEIKELIERFVRDGVFSDEDAKSVDINDIILCLNSDIMRYAAQNRHVREKEFMLYVSSKDMYVDGDDEKILVQGVIDLLILGKKNIIVDYKTGVLDETLSASYKKQLCIYKQAAENAGIHIDGAYLYSFDSGKEIMVF